MGYKSQIADKLVERIALVTKANGYSQDIKTIKFDKVRLNISDYQDFELPAVQIIDLSKLYNHEMSRSRSVWYLAVEVCLRTTEQIGIVDQKSLWNLTEDIVNAIMSKPKLDLSFVIHTKLVDELTDLHLQEPNYIGTIGLEINYYEPITRPTC